MCSRLLPLGALVAAFAFTTPGSLAGQDDDPVACARCRIDLQFVVRLGDQEGPGALVGRDLIEVDSRGRYYAVNVARRGEIAVFRPDGKFLRVVGRPGRGPGEFSVPFPIVFGPGDTMYVVDPPNQRISVLSPTYEHLATSRLFGNIRDLLRLGNGEFVLLATVPTPERAGLPLHVVDVMTGTVTTSFGSERPVLSRRQPFADARRVAPTHGDTLWVTYLNRYRFERWTTAGTLVDAFEPTPQWFEPWDSHVDSPWAERPRPAVLDIWYDPAVQLLWVMVQVPDRGWRSREVPASATDRNSLAEWEALHDVVLQVFDATGRLLASRRLATFERFTADGLMVGAREDDAGFPYMEVWRPTLRR